MRAGMMIVQPVKVGEFAVGGGSQLLWICGPCVIESRDHCLGVAATLKQIADSLGLHLVFKASFDKANRTSGKSFRGLGLDEGLRTLDAVRQATGLPVTTDVHERRSGRPGRGGVRDTSGPGLPAPGRRTCSKPAAGPGGS